MSINGSVVAVAAIQSGHFLSPSMCPFARSISSTGSRPCHRSQSDHPRDPAAGAPRSCLRATRTCAYPPPCHRQGGFSKRSTAVPPCRSSVVRPPHPAYRDEFNSSPIPKLATRIWQSRARSGQAVKIVLRGVERTVPERYDIARAIVQMWEEVRIDCQLESSSTPIIRAQSRDQLRSTAQLGQRNRRPGDFRRLPAQS